MSRQKKAPSRETQVSEALDRLLQQFRGSKLSPTLGQFAEGRISGSAWVDNPAHESSQPQFVIMVDELTEAQAAVVMAALVKVVFP